MIMGICFEEVFRFSVILIIFLIHSSDHFPVQDENTLFNFEDDWNYNLEPHRIPLINGSQLHYSLPIHTNYAKNLDLEESDQNPRTSLFNISQLHGEVIRSRVPCHVCKLAVGILTINVKSGISFDDLKQKFVSICVLFKIQNYDVCSGIFDTYGPEVVPALSVSTLNPKEICKLLLGEGCENINVVSHQWDIELPDVSKPEVLQQQNREEKPDTPIFKVLHISDTHYDPDYVEGSPANCEEPLCCRTYSTPRREEAIVPAGRWGSYEKCDAPRKLLENMFNHIALEHPDIDYIIWTGDLPPHDIWNQTKKFNLDVIKDTVEIIFNAFPNKPIFPAIGNHESSPAGNFAPPWMTDDSHSITWLYNEIANQWSRWLPASVGNTIYHGAFYSVLLRPGFRLISINTNYCHSLSWWLYINSTDPASELKWLIHELQEAENNQEKVHIIGHIAPGSSDCMESWSRNFNKIVNRYESTITGMFYGHSHYDEFEVFYEPPSYDRPTAVAYLGPSATTFTNNNPAYRIYYIDGDHDTTTREVIDHETWTFDLDEANESDNKPNWYKLYSAKETYEMNSLWPAEWDRLIKRMKNKAAIFEQFHRNYHRNSPKAPQCNKSCRVQILCDLMTSESHKRHKICREFETLSQL